jgi:SAM-dependent methyltransferase
MNDNLRANPRIWTLGWLVMRRQAEAIRALLAHPGMPLRGLAVLDFGCGSRPYEDWFTAAGAAYAGADIDARHEVAIRPDGSLPVGDGSFGMVASFQVLEHVWDVAAYLAEAKRVLKSPGWLLLSTHGSWFYHPHPGDYRRWTAEGLRREVEAHGFRLVARLDLDPEIVRFRLCLPPHPARRRRAGAARHAALQRARLDGRSRHASADDGGQRLCLRHPVRASAGRRKALIIAA